jgi:hypothetical protein
MTEQQQLAQLEQALDQVLSETDQHIKREEKEARMGLIVKAVILAFIMLYLGYAYTSFRTVDAQTLVWTAQERVKEALPEAKQQMKERLTAMAPEVVDQVFETIIKETPAVADGVEQTVKTAMTGYMDEAEEEMLVWFGEFIREKRMLLDEMFPNMPAYQKITKLRQFVVEDVEAALEGVGDTIGRGIADHEFTRQLSRLAAGENLTEKEELQRDILAIWYILVQRKLQEMEIDLSVE